MHIARHSECPHRAAFPGLAVSSLAVYLVVISVIPAPVTGQTITQAVTAEAQALAAIAEATQDGKTPSVYDRIWRITRLYQNDQNPIVQNVVLSGRLQFDFIRVRADQGPFDDWNIRRFRFGAKATLFRHVTLHSEAELNPQERDPFYLRLTDTNVQWSRSPGLRLTVGKHSAPFTMDGQTSSKELLTIDRNNLTNNLWFSQEYVPGVSASGKRSAWSYQVGVYSGGRRNREFGEFDGSAFVLTRLGYDVAERLGVRKAELVGAYVYQDPHLNNTFTARFQHIGSVTFDLETGAWGLRADVTGTDGALGQGSVLGVMAMPYYNVTEHAQVVGRYTFMTSPADNAIRLATYERSVVGGRGDRYNEFYVGFNYFFYGHKLKMQAGVTVADLRDRANDGGAYAGTSGVLALRTSW